MKYGVGRYIIAKPDFWCYENATMLTIIKIDEENCTVIYYYDNNEKVARERGFSDFYDIILVPNTPLMEELI